MKVKRMDITESVSARLTSREFEQIEKLVKMGYYLNTSDFIRSVVREKLESIQIIMVRESDVKNAKKEILKYLKKKKISVYPSEIAMDLGLDLAVAMKAVSELKKVKKIRE